MPKTRRPEQRGKAAGLPFKIQLLKQQRASLETASTETRLHGYKNLNVKDAKSFLAAAGSQDSAAKQVNSNRKRVQKESERLSFREELS